MIRSISTGQLLDHEVFGGQRVPGGDCPRVVAHLTELGGGRRAGQDASRHDLNVLFAYTALKLRPTDYRTELK